MPKAGTGWLYDQLSHHPDFWMPPVKEMHYLDRQYPKLKNAISMLDNWGDAIRRAERQGLNWGERERAFVEDLVSCREQPRKFDRYAALFKHKGTALSGDISPGYSRLTDEEVAKIATGLPLTKIILLIREPIARLWSRICMTDRKGDFDRGLLDRPSEFAAYIRNRAAIAERSFPSEIVRRWQTFANETPFRVILFDDIVDQPNTTIKEIVHFIGGDPAKSSSLPPSFNRKAKAKKLEMPDSIRAVLVDYLADEIRQCAALLGGAARAWPAIYGI